MDVLLVAITLQFLAGTAALLSSKWPRAATALAWVSLRTWRGAS